MNLNRDPMFDFLFKRRARSEATPPETYHPVQKKEPQVYRAIQQAEKQTAKQAELVIAQGFDGQEQAALVFIMQSSFADVRLQAAQHIHTEDGLQQLSLAMRHVDRRVSKIAQEKLARLQYQKKMHANVQSCLMAGQQLLMQRQLMPNQVALWDKERLSLGDYGASLEEVKRELENRLQVQIDLQRQVIDLIAHTDQLVNLNLSVTQEKDQLAQIVQKWQQISSHRQFDSVPKNQCTQITTQILRAGQSLRQRELNEQPLVDQTRSNIAEVSVNILASPSQLAQTVVEHKAVVESTVEKVVQHTRIDIHKVIQELEQSLLDGQLHQALEIDKLLRQSDEKIRGEPAQKLQSARIELKRLLDWAKWGGNVSREELIQVAEKLTAGDVSPVEIAKQVGGLRSRWKELDRTSGAAMQSLWERFDKACSTAYAVADQYFKEQAKLRAANSVAAQSLLQAMDDATHELLQSPADWKALQKAINHYKQAWRKIGAVERKQKPRLEGQFLQKMARLEEPLHAAKDAAVAVRQQLIQSVLSINPIDRGAADQVKVLQQRWQQETLCMLMDRKLEQKLWQQFRSACDVIFAQRKAQAERQKQLREQNNAARHNFCAELEATRNKSMADMATALKNAPLAWRALAGTDHGLDGRFDAAIQALEQKLAEYRMAQRVTDLANLRSRISLCQKVEATCQSARNLTEAEIAALLATCQHEWNALPKPDSSLFPATLQKALTERFNGASDQLKNRQHIEADAAAENLRQFEQHLLRIEVIRNLPSPPDLAQQRLAMQVRDLQSAMKNRTQPDSYESSFTALCTLPVQPHAKFAQRLQLVLENRLK